MGNILKQLHVVGSFWMMNLKKKEKIILARPCYTEPSPAYREHFPTQRKPLCAKADPLWLLVLPCMRGQSPVALSGAGGPTEVLRELVVFTLLL